MDAPDVRYAQSGSVNIAYQVLGGGEVDLLYVAGWISHLDLYWRSRPSSGSSAGSAPASG